MNIFKKCIINNIPGVLHKYAISNFRRNISSKIVLLEELTRKFLAQIDKYKREKNLSITEYANRKREIKECASSIFVKGFNNISQEKYITILTNCILVSRRVLFPKELIKNALIQYIQVNTKHSKERESIDSIKQREERNEPNQYLVTLLLKFIFYLNIEYDVMLYNHIYSEINNIIEYVETKELVEIARIISLFKNKKWIHHKVFSRCINEMTQRSKEGKEKLSDILIPIIKASHRVHYEIEEMQILIEHFKEEYIKSENRNIHILIKLLYNLFLCTHYQTKYVNPLLQLLKEELLPSNQIREEYPLYKKLHFNENIVLDTNFDFTTEQNKNEPSEKICNDNINRIHEIYFNTNKQKKRIFYEESITSINLYRLKFIDMIIRSDQVLFNSLYLPQANFFDLIRQLHYKDKQNNKETIFSKQAKFFLTENGIKIDFTQVDIYPVIFLPECKNTCVEFVHMISVNKKMKDSPHKFHKNYLNYKIKHLKFLGWNVILLYEHEWKKLRNYNEKFTYVKMAFKNINIELS